MLSMRFDVPVDKVRFDLHNRCVCMASHLKRNVNFL